MRAKSTLSRFLWSSERVAAPRNIYQQAVSWIQLRGKLHAKALTEKYSVMHNHWEQYQTHKLKIAQIFQLHKKYVAKTLSLSAVVSHLSVRPFDGFNYTGYSLALKYRRSTNVAEVCWTTFAGGSQCSTLIHTAYLCDNDETTEADGLRAILTQVTRHSLPTSLSHHQNRCMQQRS